MDKLCLKIVLKGNLSGNFRLHLKPDAAAAGKIANHAQREWKWKPLPIPPSPMASKHARLPRRTGQEMVRMIKWGAKPRGQFQRERETDDQ